MNLSENFLRLKEKVLIKRPVLQEILHKRGATPIHQYVNDYVDVNMNPPIFKRQNEILSVIHEVCRDRFGARMADSVTTQLEKYYFVSTADHAGPIVHPFFVNSNLLTALTLKEHSDPVLQNVIVLACANISADNSSFPRGLFFHTVKNDELQTHRLPFFSANMRPPAVYTLPPYGEKELQNIQEIIQTKHAKGEIDGRVRDMLRSMMTDIYSSDDVLKCSSYTEQVSRTNAQLWQKFFGAGSVKMPNLIYLELEDIVVKLLTKYHLNDDTVINHILFDPRYEPFINDYFDGIFGSFSRESATGTYLFWALPKGARYNQQLWRKGNYLVTKDESYKVEMTPEAVGEAIRSKELIPSLLLSFMTVSFYYGLKCLGGFNQVNYLTLMKNAYIKMNVDLGNYRSIEVCARAQTKEICDGLTLAFLGYDGGRVALASGLDMALYGDKDSWEKIVSLSKQMTLEDAINPLMPEIYRISYDEKEWEKGLLSITEKDINQLTGLDRKVKPCVDIH